MIYGVAAVFPLLSWWMTPEAPQLESHSVVFHKTHFFASPSELLQEPLAGLGENLAPLLEFLGAYLTWVAVVGCVAACVYLLAKRSSSAWLLLAVSAVPIGLQVLVLTRFFSRYAFPHIWPLLLLCGLAFVELRKTTLGRFAGAAFLLLVAVSLTTRSVAIVNDPVRSLAPSDSSYYSPTARTPASGYGKWSTICSPRLKRVLCCCLRIRSGARRLTPCSPFSIGVGAYAYMRRGGSRAPQIIRSSPAGAPRYGARTMSASWEEPSISQTFGQSTT